MKSNIEKYKKDLDRLIELGNTMQTDLAVLATSRKDIEDGSKQGTIFFSRYDEWYSEALEVVRQILPSRLSEFEELYKGNEKRRKIDGHTYRIKDWLRGVRSGKTAYGEKYYDDGAITFMAFQMQVRILESARKRFESSLFDMRRMVQADLFDSETDIAKLLLKNGFFRAAGAVTGVVLEKHLGQVCKDHKIQIKKKNPSINDYNDSLKDADVIELVTWRFIQHLADLRNLCDHDKKREPNRDEIDDLINGVIKIIKSIF